MTVKVWNGDFDFEFEIFETDADDQTVKKAFEKQVFCELESVPVVAAYDTLMDQGYTYNIIGTHDNMNFNTDCDLVIDLSEIMEDLEA